MGWWVPYARGCRWGNVSSKFPRPQLRIHYSTTVPSRALGHDEYYIIRVNSLWQVCGPSGSRVPFCTSSDQPGQNRSTSFPCLSVVLVVYGATRHTFRRPRGASKLKHLLLTINVQSPGREWVQGLPIRIQTCADPSTFLWPSVVLTMRPVPQEIVHGLLGVRPTVFILSA